MDEELQSLADISSAAGQDALPAPPPDNIPAAPPAAPPAPEAQVQQPAAPLVPGAPAAPIAAADNPYGVDWSQFDEPAQAQQPQDRFAAFADRAALEAARQNPQALYDQAAQAYGLVEQIKPELEEWAKIEEAAAPIGGRKHLAVAAELTANLFGGSMPTEPGGLPPVQKFLDQVKGMHPETYHGIISALAQNEMPMLLDTLTPYVLQKFGLPNNPETLAQLRLVAQRGAYVDPNDLQAERDYLSRLPQHVHGVFQRLPPHKKAEMVEMDRPDSAAWDLEQWGKTQAQEEREQQRLQAQQQVEAREGEYKFAEAVENGYTGLYSDFVKQGEAKNLPPVLAAGFSAMAYQGLQKHVADERRSLRAQDGVNMSRYERAVQDGNQFEIDREYDKLRLVYNQHWRTAINQHGKRPSAAAAPAPPARAQFNNQQQQPAGQFQPAAPPSGDDHMPSLAEAFARNPQAGLQQLGYTPR